MRDCDDVMFSPNNSPYHTALWCAMSACKVLTIPQSEIIIYGAIHMCIHIYAIWSHQCIKLEFIVATLACLITNVHKHQKKKKKNEGNVQLHFEWWTRCLCGTLKPEHINQNWTKKSIPKWKKQQQKKTNKDPKLIAESSFCKKKKKYSAAQFPSKLVFYK